MLGDKFRLRFEKAGVLRLLSHHDLMRVLERMLRRAGLPFKSTAGFHPGPRVVFAQSLPLGVVGRDEVVELELTEVRDSEAVRTGLNVQAPEGLRFTRVTVVPLRTTAMPRRIVYTLPLPAGRAGEAAAACESLLAQDAVWVERVRPSPKGLNIRPYLRSVAVRDNTLTLDLWVTTTGTARADELLRLLGVDDLLDAGCVLERTLVELRDEAAAPLDPTDIPPDGPADTRPADPSRATPDQPVASISVAVPGDLAAE
ncbi:MAG: TIGR03936 family radical SAM-associated protein [Gemmataceae bacterium]